METAGKKIWVGIDRGKFVCLVCLQHTTARSQISDTGCRLTVIWYLESGIWYQSEFNLLRLP